MRGSMSWCYTVTQTHQIPSPLDDLGSILTVLELCDRLTKNIWLESPPLLVSGLVAKVGSKRVEALLLIDRLTWKTLET